MTQTRFFQISLFLPFLLWSLCLLVFSFTYKEGAAFILDNLYNAYRVFVPYLIFAAALWRLAHRKPYRWLVLMAAVIPVIWAIFFVFVFLISSLVVTGTMEKWYVLLIMSFWAMVVAYLVELIPFILLVIFKEDFKSDDGTEPDSFETRLSESRPPA